MKQTNESIMDELFRLSVAANKESDLRRDYIFNTHTVEFSPEYKQKVKRYNNALQQKQSEINATARMRMEKRRLLDSGEVSDYVERLNLLEQNDRGSTLATWAEDVKALGGHPIALDNPDIDVAIVYMQRMFKEKLDRPSDKAFFFCAHLMQRLHFSTKLFWPVFKTPVEDVPFSPAEYEKCLRELTEANITCEISPNIWILGISPFPCIWTEEDELAHCRRLATLHVITNEDGILVDCEDGALGYRLNRGGIDCRFFPARLNTDDIKERLEGRLDEGTECYGYDLDGDKRALYMEAKLKQEEQLPYAIELLDDPGLDLSELSPADEYSIRLRVAHHDRLHGPCKQQWERWVNERVRKEQKALEKKVAQQKAAEEARERAQAKQQPQQKEAIEPIWMPDRDTDAGLRALWMAYVCGLRSINTMQLSYLAGLLSVAQEHDGIPSIRTSDLEQQASSLGISKSDGRRCVKTFVNAGILAPNEGTEGGYILISSAIRKKTLEKELKGAWETVEKTVIDGSEKTGCIYRLANNRYAATYVARGKPKWKEFNTTSEKVARAQVAAWRAEEAKRDQARQAAKKKKAVTTVPAPFGERQTTPEEVAVKDDQKNKGDEMMETPSAEQLDSADTIRLILCGNRVLGYVVDEEEAREYTESAAKFISYGVNVFGMEGGQDALDCKEVKRLKPIPAF